MANIKFKHLHLENFMSYSTADLDLDNVGYILVKGHNNNPNDSAKSNGSGKSSLFSAILWCLTGETASGAKDVSNIYIDETTTVCVEFTFDTDRYKITRTKNPSNLFVERNGQNKSGKGIRDTSKMLEEYLPQLTASLLSSVVILGQGLPQRFTNNTPAGRKEVLEKLSNSDFMIDDLKDKIGSRQNQLSLDKKGYENSVLKLQTAIDINQSQVTSINSELDSLNSEDNIRTQLTELESTVIESHKEDLDSKLKEFDLISDKLVQVQANVNQKPELEDTSDYREAKANLQAAINHFKSEINKLSTGGVCPTCGQELPDNSELIAQLESTLESKTADFNVICEKLTLAESNNKAKEDEAAAEYRQRCSEVITEKDKLSAEIQKLRKLVDAEYEQQKTKDLKIAQLTADLNSLNDKRRSLEAKLKELSVSIKTDLASLEDKKLKIADIDSRLLIVNKLATMVKRDFRGYLLSYIINYIDAQAKMYCTELFNTNDLEFKLDGNNISIKYCNKEYELLSGGEKQKVDIIIQLSIRDMLCKYLNFSSNILVLDEITDALDSTGSQKVFNLISNKLNDVEAVYIISHHADELNVPADAYIEVVKNSEGISTLI